MSEASYSIDCKLLESVTGSMVERLVYAMLDLLCYHSSAPAKSEREASH